MFVGTWFRMISLKLLSYVIILTGASLGKVLTTFVLPSQDMFERWLANEPLAV